MTPGVKLLSAWKQVLQLCKLASEESVVLLLAPNSNQPHVEAARVTAALMGANILSVELGDSPTAASSVAGIAVHGATNLSGNKAAVAAMKSADLVIDMMGMDRGTEQQEILDARTRILLVKEPPEVFMRLLPTEDDKRRVLQAAAKLGAARTMKVTSHEGTDLTVRLGDFRMLVQYGFADEPGRWDHAPSTFVAAWPNECSANGVVVLVPGTAILPIKEFVRSPVRLTIREGYIRDIEGEFDAKFLREYMAKFKDPEAYAVSHLGWGLKEKAHWTSLGMYDKQQSNANEARSFNGNFMFSIGPNLEGGGTRDTSCHLDIPIPGCSVHVDDDAVVVDGVPVGNAA